MSIAPELRAALDVVDPIMASADPTQALVAARCAGLLMGYHARWSQDKYRIDDVECFVESDLWNPATSRKSRSFRVAGKIDLRATHPDGQSIIFDHKTTSSDISKPDSTYWRQLAVQNEATHYMLLERLNGRKIDGAIWDVVRTTYMRPEKLCNADAKAVVKNGVYFGAKLTPEDIAEVEISGCESLLMFMWRLAYDCTKMSPDWYFQRRFLFPRNGTASERKYAAELWDHAQDMWAVRATESNPCNPDACRLDGYCCQYLDICCGNDNPDSDNWQRSAWVHPELKVFDGDGRDIITNRRIHTFQTCRRKHQLQYEMGIERVQEGPILDQLFDQLFHDALNAYFLDLKKQHHNLPF